MSYNALDKKGMYKNSQSPCLLKCVCDKQLNMVLVISLAVDCGK
jgi:hypothetical protein